MKAVKLFCLTLILAGLLAACGAKTVTCDSCGKEILLEAGSKITDEWTVFCKDCEEQIGPIISGD